MPTVSRAVLSIGSNLGDRLAELQRAVDAFADDLVAVSAVYETEPWGGVAQPRYLNAILVVSDPDTGAMGWLDRGRAVEAAAGRRRGQRWGPRSLDVDVIAVDGLRSDDPQLLLPHPRAHERAFVLVPWVEVEPTAQLPGRGPVALLVAEVDRSTVRRSDEVLRWSGR